MQLSLALQTDRAEEIDLIHRATAIYTVAPEVEALLDRLGWPAIGGRLLDPGAGDGAFVVAALARVDLTRDDVDQAVYSVRGFEFHPGAAAGARANVAAHLRGRGWSTAAAALAAARVIEERDFLLSPIEVGVFTIIAANPPYLRATRLPAGYRSDFQASTPRHAHGDLLYAFLQKAADVVAAGGLVGCVTSDRWLFNDGSAELRRRVGQRFTIRDLHRLDSASAFYRPKSRVAGTPPRVHPVTLVLDPSGAGAQLTAAPFRIDGHRATDGVPLAKLAKFQLAPWVGPKGIFVVADPSPFPAGTYAPCVLRKDIDPHRDEVMATRAWVLLTQPDQRPCNEILEHLERTMPAMSARGRRSTPWLPPETFAHRLPLDHDAVLVPRTSRRLRAVRLPAGAVPIDHDLIVISGHPVEVVRGWLNDPVVQAQADNLAARLEGGYRSFRTSLLNQLVIPAEAVAAAGVSL